jgi:hypothetical protein
MYTTPNIDSDISQGLKSQNFYRLIILTGPQHPIVIEESLYF